LESDRGSNVALDRQENSSTSELADMAVAHVDGKYRNTSGVLGFQQLYRKESIAYVDAKGIPPAEKVYRRSETNIAATPPIAKGEKQSEDRPQPNSNPPDLEPPLQSTDAEHPEGNEVYSQRDRSIFSTNRDGSNQPSSNTPSEPVVLALADPEPLIPTEQLTEESHHDDVSLIDRAGIEYNGLPMELAAPIAGTSREGEEEFAETSRLRLADNLPAAKIIVTATDDTAPTISIRMIKRVED